MQSFITYLERRYRLLSRGQWVCMAALLYIIYIIGMGGCSRGNTDIQEIEKIEDECRTALSAWEYDVTDSLGSLLLSIAEQDGEQSLKARALFYLGHFRPDVSDSLMNERERNLITAKRMATSQKDTLLLARIANAQGIWEVTRRRNYEEAQNLFSTAIKYGRQAGGREVESAATINYSELCHFLGDTLGLQYDDEIFRYAIQTENLPLQVASAYHCCLDLIYRGAGEDAIKKYTEQIQPIDSIYNYNIVPLVWALCFYENGRYEDAREVLYNSNPGSSLRSGWLYAKILNKLGHYEESNRWAADVIDVYRKQNFDDGWLEMYNIEASNYAALGDYASAYRCQSYFAEASDSVRSLRNSEQIKRLKIEYEVERKDMEIQVQKAVKKRLLWVAIMLVVIIVVGVGGYTLYNRKRNRLYRDIVRHYSESQLREKLMSERLEKALASHGTIRNENDPAESTVPLESASLPANKVDDIFERIQAEIENNRIWSDRNITRDLFAETVNTNRTYISEVIKLKTGMSYTQYMNTFRVREAIRLLSDETVCLQMKDISERAGFNSLSAFYSIFRQAVGMSPIAYRKTVIDINRQSVK